MPEDRNAPRSSTRQRGTAVVSAGSEIACTIRDLSATGARLSFQHPTILPRTFRLRFDGTDQRVTVMWRRGLFAGVKFTAPIRGLAAKKRRSWFWSR
ncbi:MAG: PilZ domain-containing protein [Propylenella sp.]